MWHVGGRLFWAWGVVGGGADVAFKKDPTVVQILRPRKKAQRFLPDILLYNKAQPVVTFNCQNLSDRNQCFKTCTSSLVLTIISH